MFAFHTSSPTCYAITCLQVVRDGFFALHGNDLLCRALVCGVTCSMLNYCKIWWYARTTHALCVCVFASISPWVRHSWEDVWGEELYVTCSMFICLVPMNHVYRYKHQYIYIYICIYMCYYLNTNINIEHGLQCGWMQSCEMRE